MAFRSTLVLIIALLSVLLARAPSAEALTFDGLKISSALIGGTVYCSNSNIAVAGTYKPMGNVHVELVCGSGSYERVIKEAITDLAGTYTFLFSVLDTLFDMRQCFLRVRVPARGSTCTLNVPTGLLRIPLVVINVLPVSRLGNVIILVGGPLTYVHGVA